MACISAAFEPSVSIAIGAARPAELRTADVAGDAFGSVDGNNHWFITHNGELMNCSALTSMISSNENCQIIQILHTFANIEYNILGRVDEHE